MKTIKRNVHRSLQDVETGGWWMMNKNCECCMYLGNCFKSEIATTNDHPSVFVRISRSRVALIIEFCVCNQKIKRVEPSTKCAGAATPPSALVLLFLTILTMTRSKSALALYLFVRVNRRRRRVVPIEGVRCAKKYPSSSHCCSFVAGCAFASEASAVGGASFTTTVGTAERAGTTCCCRPPSKTTPGEFCVGANPTAGLECTPRRMRTFEPPSWIIFGARVLSLKHQILRKYANVSVTTTTTTAPMPATTGTMTFKGVDFSSLGPSKTYTDPT